MSDEQFFPLDPARRLTRRSLLHLAASGALMSLLPTGCSREVKEGAPPSAREMARYPEKAPLMLHTDRAPQLETPWRYFAEDLTPNEAFFVRWHLQVVPTRVDLATWRLKVAGLVESPLQLSLQELKAMKPSEIVAVCQCSGNSRKDFSPRVAGAQWSNGAVGNARWKGVRLADVLERAGAKAEAVEVTFNGLEKAPSASTPDFVKALSFAHAKQTEILLAYEMNGEPLPLLNGYPLRLVVPGWYATYWVKSLAEITVLAEKYEGYWMKKAYRIPDNADASEDPDHHAKKTVPINRMNPRSLWVYPDPNDIAQFPVGKAISLEGIAFDGGSGIRTVQVSADNGKTWLDTTLAEDLGDYSFRRWRAQWTPPGVGEYQLMARATGKDGQVQPLEAPWNKGGYMRNVVERVSLHVG